MAQGEVSDAEPISGGEISEPRRRNSPSDSLSRDVEDHVLTGHESFQAVVCSLCTRATSSRETPVRGPQGTLGRFRDSSLVVGCLFHWARNRVSEIEVEQRRGSPVLVIHDGATKSAFACVIPSIGVDLPSCKNVVEMIDVDLENLACHRVVFRCDNEPSILALLRAVQSAWTGDVVQETFAEGDPQSNGAAECTANVVNGHVSSIKLAVESASSVGVPADHDLLILGFAVCNQHAPSVFRG